MLQRRHFSALAKPIAAAAAAAAADLIITPQEAALSDYERAKSYNTMVPMANTICGVPCPPLAGVQKTPHIVLAVGTFLVEFCMAEEFNF